MNKIDEAIARITEAMMQANAPLARAVEEHLTEICTTEQVADQLLQEDKNLKGAIDALWAEARKRKTGNSAYIPPEEAFEIVEAYFGITPDMKRKVVSFRPAVRNILDEI